MKPASPRDCCRDFTAQDPRFILGCNFSCFKDKLLAINGFNEDYMQPGAARTRIWNGDYSSVACG